MYICGRAVGRPGGQYGQYGRPGRRYGLAGGRASGRYGRAGGTGGRFQFDPQERKPIHITTRSLYFELSEFPSLSPSQLSFHML